MFIGLLQLTNDNEISIETDSFEKAWDFLHNNADNEFIERAVVLACMKWPDGRCNYPLKEIAAMRLLK